jgi:hypothetical protein
MKKCSYNREARVGPGEAWNICEIKRGVSADEIRASASE